MAFCRFELRLRISLGAGKLTLIPRVRNLDGKAFSFMFALRNYLSVSDVRFALYPTHYGSCMKATFGARDKKAG